MIRIRIHKLPLGSLKFLAIILGTVLMNSCSMGVLNEDSYGKKWENTYLWFNPDNLETIYTAKTGDISKAVKILNDTDYLVQWNKEDAVYNLTFTSHVHPIHSAYFDGFAADNFEEEIPFVIRDNTYTITSTKLLPATDSLYRISLSEDLSK